MRALFIPLITYAAALWIFAYMIVGDGIGLISGLLQLASYKKKTLSFRITLISEHRLNISLLDNLIAFQCLASPIVITFY